MTSPRLYWTEANFAGQVGSQADQTKPFYASGLLSTFEQLAFLAVTHLSLAAGPDQSDRDAYVRRSDPDGLSGGLSGTTRALSGSWKAPRPQGRKQGQMAIG